MSPRVSVVIPVYNREKTIGRAIESCLAQSHAVFEIVLVDDCSTDDLGRALSPFAGEDRLRLIRQEVNQGVSAARNRGVQEARGELIAFLDSDDAWHPTKIERQLSGIADRALSDNLLSATLTEVVSDSAPTTVTPTRRLSPDVRFGDYMFVRKLRRRLAMVADDRAMLHDSYFIHVSSMLLPRKLALDVPFRTSLTQYEDLAFFVDLESRGTEILLIEEALTTQHDDRRPGRLGHRDDITRGHRFLSEMGAALSDDARLAFESSHLAHLYARERPLHALGITIRAFARGLIGGRTVVGILLRALFGQGGHRAVRDRLKAFRFARG